MSTRITDRSHPSTRQGHTLVELVIAANVAVLLMAGMASSVYIASQAFNQADGTAGESVRATFVLTQFDRDISQALAFTALSANAAAFTVPDRDGDGRPEKLRYAWSGTPGDPLTYEVNGSSPATIAENVQAFSLNGITRFMAAPVLPPPGGGSQTVLLVVIDKTALTAQEDARKALIESWGYDVALITASESQANYDAVVATSNVAYISEEINSSDVGTKLTDAPIGVVSEEINLVDDFGLSSSFDWPVPTDYFDAIDNYHYITESFGHGALTIFNTNESVAHAAGTLAPDLKILGKIHGGSGAQAGLAVVESGDELVGGGPAAGRRVQLPWGANTMDINILNDDGRTIMRRSIEWAAGAGGPLADKIVLSTATNATLGGLSFNDEDLAEYNPPYGTATMYLDGSSHGLWQDIDAVHVLANGHIVLSTIASSTLGGLSFEREDLVDYDPETDTATMLFDGSARFTAGSMNICAVYVMDNGHLLLCNDSTATLGGLSFQNEDIIEYDPATDTATMYLDGDTVGLYSWIQAVHLLDNGHLVLSINSAGTLGGLSYDESDLIEYDPVADTATLYFDGGLFADLENVRSVHIGPGSGDGVLGVLAYWKLDETSGSTASDSSGGHDGTLNGNPTWTPGRIDGSLNFDGSGDYVTTNGNFTPPPVGTVSFWMKVSGSPGSHQRVLGLNDKWEVRHVTTGTPDGIPYGLVFDLGVAGINTEFATTVTIDTPGHWYHIAASYDTTNDSYAVYVDGVPDTSGTYSSALSVPAANPLSLGTRTGSTQYFSGTLDDVRVYNRVLSATEVATLASGG